MYFEKITFEDFGSYSYSLLKHVLLPILFIIVLRKICRQNFILSFVITRRNHPLFNYLKGITTIRLKVLFLCSLQTFNIYFNTSTRVVDAQTWVGIKSKNFPCHKLYCISVLHTFPFNHIQDRDRAKLQLMSIVGLNLGRISCHWVFTISNFILLWSLLNTAACTQLMMLEVYEVSNYKRKGYEEKHQKMKEAPLPFFWKQMKKVFWEETHTTFFMAFICDAQH